MFARLREGDLGGSLPLSSRERRRAFSLVKTGIDIRTGI
jgi:hypothetical protein